MDAGKRLRPTLVILVSKLYGRPSPAFERLAAAIEMLHTATLIHDDVLDDAALRRGRKTLHTTWPVAAAVLAGDYLLAEAVSLVAELADARIVRILADTLRVMCSGEIADVFNVHSAAEARRAYYASIKAKAASLFAASSQMAGILADASAEQVVALHLFGWELGIAFQIVDDVLDFVGTESQLGKQVGSDLRQGLVTLPSLCYLEASQGENAVQTVLSGTRDEEHLAAAVQGILASGAIESAMAEAREHAARSKAALRALPDSRWRRILADLPERVLARRN
jgi:geranylgeranyl pyrophosphate synthase